MRIIIECPESNLHLEAGYIYADCPFAQLQPSCSPAADHTFSCSFSTLSTSCAILTFAVNRLRVDLFLTRS